MRTWLYAARNEGVARKTVSHLSFMITSVLLGWHASGPADVVVVSSPTFFSIGAGWLLARLKRARLVVEVRDLWPAIFTELGVLTNRRVIRVLERLELAAYAAADTVIVVSDGFRANLIGAGCRPTRCTRSATASTRGSSILGGHPTRNCAPGSAPPRRLPGALRGDARDLTGAHVGGGRRRPARR